MVFQLILNSVTFLQMTRFGLGLLVDPSSVLGCRVGTCDLECFSQVDLVMMTHAVGTSWLCYGRSSQTLMWSLNCSKCLHGQLEWCDAIPRVVPSEGCGEPADWTPEKGDCYPFPCCSCKNRSGSRSLFSSVLREWEHGREVCRHPVLLGGLAKTKGKVGKILLLPAWSWGSDHVIAITLPLKEKGIGPLRLGHWCLSLKTSGLWQPILHGAPLCRIHCLVVNICLPPCLCQRLKTVSLCRCFLIYPVVLIGYFIVSVLWIVFNSFSFFKTMILSWLVFTDIVNHFPFPKEERQNHFLKNILNCVSDSTECCRTP